MGKRRRRDKDERDNKSRASLVTLKPRQKNKPRQAILAGTTLFPLKKKMHRPISRAIRKNEIETKKVLTKIEQGKVRPIMSNISPLSCQAKKAKARREYFGMKKAGRGGRLNRPHRNRFTVEC